MTTIKNTLRDLIFENIDDKYAWGNYGEFKVMMMRENGYINVTKLCKEGGKEFFTWKQNKSSELFLEAVFPALGIPRAGLLITINSGNTDTLIRGTYAHPELVPHIASWVSASFAIKVSRIVNEYFVKEEKERCARLEAEKNVLQGEKSDLIKSFEEERRRAEEHRLKMDEEFKKADEHRKQAEKDRKKSEEERKQAEEERKKSEEERKQAEEERKKAEEERKKAEERYLDMCKKYGFQTDILVDVKHELGNVKETLEATEEKMDINNELMEINNELMEVAIVRLEHVEEKLGIAKEIVVPKEQNIEYHEMFTLLKRRQFDPESDWEYYAICGQTKYVKTTRTRKMRTDGMVEVLSFEYTPNTKNILHRVKEQLRESIDYRGNNIDRKPGVTERRLLRLIRDIENERVEIMD
jgi:hypothetical protein